MKNIVKNLQDGFIKYHGCGVYRTDGTNVLITKKRPCFNPTNACFWMLASDINKKVRTRNNEANDRIYHRQSLKRQYQTELKRKKQYQYYSTGESSNESTDESSDESAYDSDDNKLIIDIKNQILKMDQDLGFQPPDNK